MTADDTPSGATRPDEPTGAAQPQAPPERPPLHLGEHVPPSLVFRWAAAGTAGVLLVLFLAWGVYSVRGILVLVLTALFVAVSLDPAVRWLVGRGLRRGWAVTIVVLAAALLFGLFVWSVVPPMAQQGGRLVDDLPVYLRRVSTGSRTLRTITDRYHLTDRLTALAADIPARLAGGAVGFVQRFFGLLASTLTVIVLAIYFMADMPRLRHGAVILLPHHHRPGANRVVDVVVDKVGAYMIGNIAISLIAGFASFVFLEIARVPFALPLAVTVALTDLIPMIGATLGAVICVLVASATVGFWPRGVVVLAFFVGYQQVENYLIAPHVLRGTVDLSPVAVLVVALLGGAVLGLVGAIMAIPIAATVKVVLSPMATRTPAANGSRSPPGSPTRPDGGDASGGDATSGGDAPFGGEAPAAGRAPGPGTGTAA